MGYQGQSDERWTGHRCIQQAQREEVFRIMSLTIVTRLIGKGALVASKHAPAILTGLGIAGFTATTVLAAKQTLSVGEATWEDLNELSTVKAAEDEEKFEKKDIQIAKARAWAKLAGSLVKHYALPLSIGTASAISLILAHRISAKRIAGLSMAYAGLEESFRKYQDKMKESLGEETVEKIIDHSNEKALDEAKKQYYDETGREFQLKPEEFMRELGVSPYAVVFDQNAGAWEGNEDYSLMILHAQENYANDILRTRGYLLLNEVYKGLGLPQTSAGAVVGWVYDNEDGDGIVEKNGKPLTVEMGVYKRLFNENITTEMQAQLKKIGINVNIVSHEKSTYLKPGEFELSLYSVITMPTGDPYAFLRDSLSAKGVSNFGHYDNPVVEQLLADLPNTFDPTKRIALVNHIQQQVIDDAAMDFIGFNNMQVGISKKVTGFLSTPSDYYHVTKDLDKK
nr:MAG TPA: hypothetical protein [Caudoviricetes sp.]